MKYEFSQAYDNFRSDAEELFAYTLEQIMVDELCDDMFDAYIETEVLQMHEDLKMQYEENCTGIEEARRLAKGELAAEEGRLQDLEADLAYVESEIGKYRSLQEI